MAIPHPCVLGVSESLVAAGNEYVPGVSRLVELEHAKPLKR